MSKFGILSIIVILIGIGSLVATKIELANGQVPHGKKLAPAGQIDDDAALFMRAKLSNAQKVLGGLVSEDFEAIADGAERMKKIAEAVHWPTSIDEIYQHHSFEFRRQCDKLVEHAKAKDLRAAHYAYLHMSTTCIDCHEYFKPRFRIERKHKGPVRLIPTEWEGSSRQLEPPEPDQDKDTET